MGKDVRETKEEEKEPEYKTHWPQFKEELEARLIQGHKEYGDKSFELSPWDLVGEIQQEVMDIVGWGFILWVRLEKLNAAIGKIQDNSKRIEGGLPSAVESSAVEENE